MHETLSKRERELVRACADMLLRDETWYPGEFSTRVGMDERRFSELVESWVSSRPLPTGLLADAQLAVDNCLNEVLHGIRFPEVAFRRRGISREEVEALWRKWEALGGSW